MTIGENIKKIRKEKRLTQKQLGDKCGINEANIRKYENGKQNPKIETSIKIADALGVSLSELDPRGYKSRINNFIDSYFDEEASHLQELVNNINYLSGYTFHSESGLPSRYEMMNRENLIDTLWIEYPDGDILYIDYNDLFSLNNDTDRYLNFLLEELRKKKREE